MNFVNRYTPGGHTHY